MHAVDVHTTDSKSLPRRILQCDEDETERTMLKTNMTTAAPVTDCDL